MAAIGVCTRHSFRGMVGFGSRLEGLKREEQMMER
jgi:hypothetical protein